MKNIVLFAIACLASLTTAVLGVEKKWDYAFENGIGEIFADGAGGAVVGLNGGHYAWIDHKGKLIYTSGADVQPAYFTGKTIYFWTGRNGGGILEIDRNGKESFTAIQNFSISHEQFTTKDNSGFFVARENNLVLTRYSFD